MAAGKGRSYIVKISNGTALVYTTLGGVQSLSETLNNGPVDITSKDNAPNRTLLEGAGLFSESIAVSGVFDDSAYADTLEAAARANTHLGLALIHANSDTVTGNFMVSSYARTGGVADAETFTANFESSGATTLTRA